LLLLNPVWEHFQPSEYVPDLKMPSAFKEFKWRAFAVRLLCPIGKPEVKESQGGQVVGYLSDAARVQLPPGVTHIQKKGPPTACL